MRLSATMSAREFDNGYWYAVELKKFAVHIGIPAAGTLRKDELERAIKRFLATGKTGTKTSHSFALPGPRDSARPLSARRRVINYTNDKATKRFLDSAAAAQLGPGFKRKSGSRYRLNRWRENQLASGVRITYGDLVKEYVRLNQATEPFARIPHVRYINFLSDFLANEQGATRKQGIAAWKKLKTLDAKKDYQSWVASRRRHLRTRGT